MHAHPARAFAKHRDARSVSAEFGDIGLHPFQSRDLVQEAEIAPQPLGGQSRMGKEAKAAKAIIEADENHAIAREILPRIDARRRTAIHKAAAMDPHHHRQLVPGLGRGGFPHVEVEAVLGGRGGDGCGVGRERRLGAVTPCHATTGWGARQRLAPVGAAA